MTLFVIQCGALLILPWVDEQQKKSVIDDPVSSTTAQQSIMNTLCDTRRRWRVYDTAEMCGTTELSVLDAHTVENTVYMMK